MAEQLAPEEHVAETSKIRGFARVNADIGRLNAELELYNTDPDTNHDAIIQTEAQIQSLLREREELFDKREPHLTEREEKLRRVIQKAKVRIEANSRLDDSLGMNTLAVEDDRLIIEQIKQELINLT